MGHRNTCRQETGAGDFQSKVSGTGVQILRNGVLLSLAVRREIHSFRMVLSHEPIRVLKAASLPGTAPITELDFDFGRDDEIDVFLSFEPRSQVRDFRRTVGSLRAALIGASATTSARLSDSSTKLTKCETNDRRLESAAFFDAMREMHLQSPRVATYTLARKARLAEHVCKSDVRRSHSGVKG